MTGSAPPVPHRLADATPGWLTAALRSAGALSSDGPAVAAVTSTVIGQGVGLMGELARLSLTYTGPALAAPSTVILKLPAPTAETRQLGILLGFYDREVRFYREIAATLSLRVPRCYYAEADAAAGDYALLLEDMADGRARVGDQVAGCSAEEAGIAVRALGRFHARWWARPELQRLEWLPPVNSPILKGVAAIFPGAWPVFLQHFGDVVPSPVVAVGEALGAKIPALMDALAERPPTIVHGDFRLDNLFFGDFGAGPDVAVIDWQITNRGPGVLDAAYFIGQSLPVDLRRRHERDLLRRYHDELQAGGVTGYPFERCWQDYRLAILADLLVPVTAGGALDPTNERGAALIRAITGRAAAAVGDLDAGELLAAL